MLHRIPIDDGQYYLLWGTHLFVCCTWTHRSRIRVHWRGFYHFSNRFLGSAWTSAMAQL